MAALLRPKLAQKSSSVNVTPVSAASNCQDWRCCRLLSTITPSRSQMIAWRVGCAGVFWLKMLALLFAWVVIVLLLGQIIRVHSIVVRTNFMKALDILLQLIYLIY